jgi:ERCC4-type nuclease
LISYKILVDFRERHNNTNDVCAVLKNNGIHFELTELKVGDFLISDDKNIVCIERKLFSDFVGSIYDKRLIKQLRQMDENFSNSYLVIVGSLVSYKKEFFKNDVISRRRGFHRNTDVFSRWKRLEEMILGFKASVSCRYNNIKLLEAEDDMQFVKLLVKIAEKSTDGKVISDLWLVEKKSKEKVFVNILNAFPNMGDDRIKAILDAGYSNLRDLQMALYEGYFDVDGIGKKTIEFLKEGLL